MGFLMDGSLYNKKETISNPNTFWKPASYNSYVCRQFLKEGSLKKISVQFLNLPVSFGNFTCQQKPVEKPAKHKENIVVALDVYLGKEFVRAPFLKIFS